MAEIVWTHEAARCLEGIHDYIAADNPIAAHKVVSGIYDKIQLLRSQCRLGQRYEPIADREVREMLYGHYRIAHLLVNEEHIEILGIFHGSMDFVRFAPAGPESVPSGRRVAGTQGDQVAGTLAAEVWARRGHRLQFGEILRRRRRCNRSQDGDFETCLGRDTECSLGAMLSSSFAVLRRIHEL